MRRQEEFGQKQKKKKKIRVKEQTNKETKNIAQKIQRDEGRFFLSITKAFFTECQFFLM